MSVAELLQEVAADAEAAGAVVTLSPGQVPVLLSQSDEAGRARPVLLVGAPTATTVGLSGRASLDVPLLLFVPPPANWPNLQATLDVLVRLLPVFPGTWTTTVAEIGDLALPAYSSTIGRKTP